MTEPTPNDTVQEGRRWLLPAFFISVAINLLIVGVIVGVLATRPGPDRTEPGAREARALVGAPFFRALPADDRRLLLREIVRNRDRLRENRSELRARFETFLSALQTDPFDADTVRRVMAEQRAAASRRQDIGEALLIERLGAMSLEDRKAYADRIARALRNIRQN